jgi:cytochrome c peroxidase
MKTSAARSFFSSLVVAAGPLVGGLLLGAACGEVSAPAGPLSEPSLKCPTGLKAVWIDQGQGTAECQVPLPLGEGEAPRTGLQMAFPAMVRPPGSQSTPERIELGRLLFFDPVLSGDNTLACASCHHPDHGFTDNRAVAIGIHGQKGSRSAPTIWNAAFYREQFWDGRAATLEDQAKGPIQNPIEMGEDPAHLIAELQAIPEYKSRFDAAFAGSAGSAITLDNIAAAIAAFERTLLAVNTPFDRYAAGDSTAMPPAAVRGLNLFRSVSTRCFECHGTPTFANPDFKVIGVPSVADTHQLDPDLGRGALLSGKAYANAFKIPTLRNIAKTAPYMHNGVFKTLEEVLEFYADGGGLGHGYHPGNIDDKIRKFDLAPSEKADLVAFLNALTDESRAPALPTQVPSGLPVPSGPLP